MCYIILKSAVFSFITHIHMFCTYLSYLYSPPLYSELVLQENMKHMVFLADKIQNKF